MIDPREMHHLYGSSRSNRMDDAIAPRYRDGRGGINLEQVEKDRRQARRQVIRAMIRRLKKSWQSV